MPFEKEAMESLEAAEQRRKLTEPEHVELIRRADCFRLGANPTDEAVDHANRLITDMSSTLRALSAALQEPVEVKPLWSGVGPNIAETPLGTYSIGRLGGEWNVALNDKRIARGSSPTFEQAEKDAKAAAQSDYDARVRAMLIDRGE